VPAHEYKNRVVTTTTDNFLIENFEMALIFISIF